MTVELQVDDVFDEAVRGEHAVLVIAPEECDLDLLALVLVGVILHPNRSLDAGMRCRAGRLRPRGFSDDSSGKVPQVSRSAQQAAENEATFRLANERLSQKASELELGDQLTPYLCECEDERCTKVVELSRDEYEEVRAHPRRFVMVRGHQKADEQVVRERSRYAVVEKAGEEGELVARRDPRSPSG